MDNYKMILFDLDGTLSDPKEGITKSVQYALEKMGMVETDFDKLKRFIGPPLQV
jgi:phosphoglycolate phosphatase